MSLYQQHSYKRSIGWSTWHFEWCTKYRYKIFGSNKSRILCKILLHEAAKRYNFTIFDSEVDCDHVHVVVSLPLTMTPLDCLNSLTGFTSKCLFVEMPELRKIYKSGHIWSPGKFVGSVGHITLERAKAYLQAHHAKKSYLGNPCSGATRKSCPVGQAFRPGRMSISSKLVAKNSIVLYICKVQPRATSQIKRHHEF